MKTAFDVAIVGATGIVGTTALEILQERGFPINNLYLLASERSVGDTREFNNKTYAVEDLNHFDFSKTQICFFCTSNALSEQFAPIAAREGNVVIDKSSFFRYDAEVPLIVPEVNLPDLQKFKNKNIIANPNCNTVPIVMALKPIYDAVGVKRIDVATYQSVSGSGKDGVKELAEQTALLLNGKPVKPKVYTQQIAFNILPHIDELLENGFTKEEMKIVWETQKILNDTSIMINPTSVRVPVFYGHSAAVHIETDAKISVKQAEKLLKNFRGVKVFAGKNPYPTPMQAAGVDDILVGRIRPNLAYENGLSMWIVGDNLRKGAALNAVQIAEKLVAEYL